MTEARQTPTTADLARPAASEENRSPDADAGDGRSLEDDSRDRAQPASPRDEELEPLLPADRGERYRGRWSELQGAFVDEPRRTVEEADGLVAELMQELATGFSETRASLEEQWTRGDDVSTEDLRVALQRYRSFFERLLAA